MIAITFHTDDAAEAAALIAECQRRGVRARTDLPAAPNGPVLRLVHGEGAGGVTGPARGAYGGAPRAHGPRQLEAQ